MCGIEEETNIEGIVSQLASQFPFEEPETCRLICLQLPHVVNLLLAMRAKRQAIASDD